VVKKNRLLVVFLRHRRVRVTNILTGEVIYAKLARLKPIKLRSATCLPKPRTQARWLKYHFFTLLKKLMSQLVVQLRAIKSGTN
jgi:hypothetical protein